MSFLQFLLWFGKKLYLRALGIAYFVMVFSSLLSEDICKGTTSCGLSTSIMYIDWLFLTVSFFIHAKSINNSTYRSFQFLLTLPPLTVTIYFLILHLRFLL